MREGWERVALGTLTTKRDNFTPVVADEQYKVVGVQRSGWGLVDREPVRGDSMKFTKLMKLEEDDLVYRVITAFEAPSTVVESAFAGTYVTPQTFPVFKIHADRMLPAYMRLLTTSPVFHDAMAARCTGTVLRRKTISVGAYQSIPISLPPLPEQRRIVDLIGSLDEAIEAAHQNLHAYRVAAIALRAESFNAWLGTCPSELAGDAFEVMLGRQKSVAQTTGDHVIPYLRAGNIMEGCLSLDDVLTMNFSPKEQEKYCLAPGDVLVVEGGSIGQTARWQGEIEGAIGFDKHVLRIRAVVERSTTAFAYQWARWCYESGIFAETATGSTIKALGFSRAKRLRVPLPPLDVQISEIGHLESADAAATEANGYLGNLRTLRSNLLTALLSGEHKIPSSYDEHMGVVA